LLVPGAAAFLVELRPEGFGDRLEVFGVLDGVIDHGLRKRTARPVGLLAALVERDAAKLLDERAVTEGLQAEQLRGEHGIENGLRLGRAGAAEHAQVEVGAVQNPGVAAGRRPEFVERKGVERVDEEMAARRA
jgi:hypothetical protein